jgi:hypothetical protein
MYSIESVVLILMNHTFSSISITWSMQEYIIELPLSLPGDVAGVFSMKGDRLSGLKIPCGIIYIIENDRISKWMFHNEY